MTAEKTTRQIAARYETLAPALRTAVRRMCPAWLAAQADDLVQEALVKLWRMGLGGEGEREVPSSYLWRVAHSVLVDEIRRRRRRHEVPMDAEPEVTEREAERPGPERWAAGAGAGRAIRECLRGIVPPRRRAVTLHLLEHSVPEIARLLGWPEKKAENAVYRGLASLRRCLSEKGWEP